MQIDKIVDDLLNRFNHLVVKNTWGETSLFFNPNETSAHGSYFVTIKESDGENDQASNLDRDGIFRVSFGVTRNSYEALFGPKPPRPARGGVVKTGHDFTQTNLLMPIQSMPGCIGFKCLILRKKHGIQTKVLFKNLTNYPKHDLKRNKEESPYKPDLIAFLSFHRNQAALNH